MSDNLQKLGALAFALVAISVSGTAIHNALSPEDRILIPSLGDERYLSGQVSTGGVPINDFTAAQAALGVTLPKDAHNFFTCSTGGAVGVGAHDLGQTRAWVYEFTGTEPPFTGDFWLSTAELSINPHFAGINTLSTYKQGKRYYSMGETDLYVKCGEGLSRNEFCGDNICQSNEDVLSCGDDCNECGDGFVFGIETCDDNDVINGDGCNASCQVEAFYECTGAPSSCGPIVPLLPSASSSTGPTCTDTDGGHNITTKGTVTLNGSAEDDSCESNNVVVELSCTSTGLKAIESVDCGTGFTCTDGACVESLPLPTNITDCLIVPGYFWDTETLTCHASRPACSDPDSTSTNPERVKGSIWGYIQGITGVSDRIRGGSADGCVDSDTVLEHVCVNTHYFEPREIDCDAGYYCNDGACITDDDDPAPTCTDTDGDNLFTKGTVTHNGQTLTDECISREGAGFPGTVREHVCPVNAAVNTTHNCAFGCVDGACVRESDLPDPLLELHSATLDGENLTVTYSKNFDDCAELKNARSNRFDSGTDFICEKGDNVTVTGSSNFTRTIAVGSTIQIQICNSADRSLCSEALSIEREDNREPPVSNYVQISEIRDPNFSANKPIPIGQVQIGEFEFKTHPGINTFELDAIIFSIDAKDVSMRTDNFKIYNSINSNAIAKLPCRTLYATGQPFTTPTTAGNIQLLVECSFAQTFIVDRRIRGGDAGTFILEALISNANTGSNGSVSHVQVSLQDYTSANQAYGPTGSHIKWSNLNGNGNRNQSFEYLVPSQGGSTIHSTRYTNNNRR